MKLLHNFTPRLKFFTFVSSRTYLWYKTHSPSGPRWLLAKHATKQLLWSWNGTRLRNCLQENKHPGKNPGISVKGMPPTCVWRTLVYERYALSSRLLLAHYHSDVHTSDCKIMSPLVDEKFDVSTEMFGSLSSKRFVQDLK